MNINQELINFIKSSPSPFHSANTIKDYLDKSGFKYLPEGSSWKIKSGKYYTMRNHSSVIAFEIPKKIEDYHFQMTASHSDSPTYKLKAKCELSGPSEYIRIDTEGYGGMIDYTWFDKPLSVAGRVLYKKGKEIVSSLVNIDKDILIIPSLAIHQNPGVNKGYDFNKQVDLMPLFSAGKLKAGDFNKMLAENLGIKPDAIVAKDLFLVNRQEGKIWGYKDEFVSSPKLDDLQAAFSSLKGFLASECKGAVNVYACFDNEEVGSRTKQGAMSTFLADTLTRINTALGKTDDDYHSAIAKSFMVSFDNAHALHPNHPEKEDAVNHPYMNKGIVIKENAAQSYTTDAFSRAVFMAVCEAAKVPVQVFANRSDTPGGGTLGNISNIQVSVHSVDIGIAQLAMHSSYETAGSVDTKYAVDAMKKYYSSLILIDESEKFSIK